MSKKLKKKKKFVKSAVKASPPLSDKERLELLTSPEIGKERPEECDNCGSHSSSLKKHGKEFWCIPCIKDEEK